jgi:hypothetical protein
LPISLQYGIDSQYIVSTRYILVTGYTWWDHGEAKAV